MTKEKHEIINLEDIILGLFVIAIFFGGLYVIPWCIVTYIGYSFIAVWIAETLFFVAIILGISVRDKLTKGG